MKTPFPTSLGARFEVHEAFAETPFELSFRAHDQVLQRDVLLKMPAREALQNWSGPVKERMLREARALAKVRHENITPIHWVEETPDGPLLVLDLPEGELLAERLQRGPLEIDATIDLGIQLAAALAHVHFHGVVHRAVGPSTVRLLANGRVQLGSFTFAKEFGLRGQGSSLAHVRRGETEVARFLPDYSAPEQIAGQAADPRADVFALGCTLFRCLAGRDPFPPGHDQEPMPDLRALRKEVGKPLAEVIRKCTLHGRTARYATAQEVVDALKALRGGMTPPGASSRRTVTFAAIGVVAAALLVPLVVSSWPDSGSGGDRDPEWQGSYEQRYAKPYGRHYRRVHGLFVAIGEAYGDSVFGKLRNPVREIERVSERLKANDSQWAEPGAIVVLPERNATERRIDEALRKIEQEAEEEDGVLFYFAGHGSKDDYMFALAAADVSGKNLETDSGHLSRERLLNFASHCKAKHMLLILDCCHAGAVFDLAATRGRGPKDGEPAPGDFLRQQFSREFLCSAGKDEAAKDGAELSPFCEALLAQLALPSAPNAEYVAARFLGNDIAKIMHRANGNRCAPLQMPEIRPMQDQKGSFVFRLATPK